MGQLSSLIKDTKITRSIDLHRPRYRECEPRECVWSCSSGIVAAGIVAAGIVTLYDATARIVECWAY
jgi:hypothetical protein